MANKYPTYGNLARKPEKRQTVASPRRQQSTNSIASSLDHVARARVAVIVAVAAVAVLTLVFTRCYVANAGYSLDKVRHSLMTVRQENERLRLDIAKLKAPSRIQYIAGTQLGMVLPAKVYYAQHNKQ